MLALCSSMIRRSPGCTPVCGAYVTVALSLGIGCRTVAADNELVLAKRRHHHLGRVERHDWASVKGRARGLAVLALGGADPLDGVDLPERAVHDIAGQRLDRVAARVMDRLSAYISSRLPPQMLRLRPARC